MRFVSLGPKSGYYNSVETGSLYPGDTVEVDPDALTERTKKFLQGGGLVYVDGPTEEKPVEPELIAEVEPTVEEETLSTEEDLLKLTVGALRKICGQMKLGWVNTDKKADLIDRILAARGQ